MRRAELVVLLALAGCDAPERPNAGEPAPPPPPSAPPFAAAAMDEASARPSLPASTDDWRAIARPTDRDRLARLPEAWREALADARREHAAELAALGALADPEAGLPRPQPAPGLYRCRVVKLGSVGGTLSYVAYPDFRCRIDLTPGGDLTLTKLTGSQRTSGQLYPERDVEGVDTDRLIYLGSQAWGADEPSAPGYGRSEARDQIGVLERIGPDRYRLALPWPRQESRLDLLELERVGN